MRMVLMSYERLVVLSLSHHPCGNHYSRMRLPRPSGIPFIIFVILMVSCGALRCLWERDTDFHGLDRHRTTCKYYQKESKLAAEKRRDRARESASQNLRSQLAESGRNITCVGHYKFTDTTSLRVHSDTTFPILSLHRSDVRRFVL
jgi:hypothetical protein